MAVHPHQTDLDMRLAAVIERHTPCQMSGREWGDERVAFVMFCPECACRAIECDVAVAQAELARLRAALVERDARRIYAKEWTYPEWGRADEHHRQKAYKQARAELTAEGLLP